MKTTINLKNWLMLAATGCSLALSAPTLPAIEKAETPKPDEPQADEPATNSTEQSGETKPWKWAGRNRDAVVVFGKNAVLKADETAEAVVVICGSARVEGKVHDAVVAICGDVTISGEVGDAVVAVMGNVKLDPGAKVGGDAVSVGGVVKVAEGASVGGHIQEVDFGGWQLPKMEWLRNWLRECVFKFRPLAPHAGWVAWSVAGGFFLLYLLIALAFPGAVQACVNRLTEQPATTFLTGLLVKMLVPFVLGILLITGIGIIGVPFLMAAVVLAKLFGKAALFIYLGQQLGRGFKAEVLQRPLVAFLLGWILITLLYMVPFLGLFTMAVTSMWAVGAAVMAVISRSRREAPPKAASPPPMAPSAMAFTAAAPPIQPSGAAPAATAAAGFAPPVAPGGPQAIPPAILPPGLTGVPDALTNPRASFWLRMGAGFLDLVVVGIVWGLVALGPTCFRFLILSVAYFAGMWAWKGTTVGGVVTGLKVARLDGQPVSFAVALVRALGAWFSTVVMFLGFFWIAFDRDRQGWHDKIAGTVVVRLPRGTPLVCL